jgi:hypothetical protein
MPRVSSWGVMQPEDVDNFGESCCAAATVIELHAYARII